MSCYIVQEIDGARFELEDDSGFLVLEDCIPTPGGDIVSGGPLRRGRRRRREVILRDEDEIFSVLLNEL